VPRYTVPGTNRDSGLAVPGTNRDSRQSVTAPLLAVETSFEYFASTPRM